MSRVAVYCGSRSGGDPVFAEAAEALGRGLASRGIDLVYGGGRAGLMGIVADAVLAGGCKAVGVMPTHLVRREIAHDGLSELHEVDTMHQRKAMMIELADAFVALPGGVGTLEELAEVLSWARMGILTKPIGVLDTGGYYRPLLGFLDGMVSAGFIEAAERDLVVSHREPEGLLEILRF